jgi:hypothetical protein
MILIMSPMLCTVGRDVHFLGHRPGLQVATDRQLMGPALDQSAIIEAGYVAHTEADDDADKQSKGANGHIIHLRRYIYMFRRPTT